MHNTIAPIILYSATNAAFAFSKCVRYKVVELCECSVVSVTIRDCVSVVCVSVVSVTFPLECSS